MERPWAVLDTSFWVVGHRVDVLTYLFRFFTVCVPEAVRTEVLAPDPRYPHPVYGYQELFRCSTGPALWRKVSGHAKKNEHPQARKTGDQIYPPHHRGSR